MDVSNVIDGVDYSDLPDIIDISEEPVDYPHAVWINLRYSREFNDKKYDQTTIELLKQHQLLLPQRRWWELISQDQEQQYSRIEDLLSKP